MANDKDKMDKTKITNQIKHVPKDAQVIMSIMKELNITEYEPRVTNQLLEFVYRYVTCILDDAKVFANHARKKTIDMDDVRLATEMVLDKAFTCPPPRQVLAKLAEVRNSMPLPPIRPHCGLRLPPDRYCLTACNYKLRSLNQPKKMTKSALEARSNIKTQIKVGSSNVVGIKRPAPVPAKAQIVTVPKPMIKFTTVAKPKPTEQKVHIISGTSETKINVDHHDTVLSTPTSAASVAIGSISVAHKRERDEEEFEIIP